MTIHSLYHRSLGGGEFVVNASGVPNLEIELDEGSPNEATVYILDSQVELSPDPIVAMGEYLPGLVFSTTDVEDVEALPALLVSPDEEKQLVGTVNLQTGQITISKEAFLYSPAIAGDEPINVRFDAVMKLNLDTGIVEAVSGSIGLSFGPITWAPILILAGLEKSTTKTGTTTKHAWEVIEIEVVGYGETGKNETAEDLAEKAKKFLKKHSKKAARLPALLLQAFSLTRAQEVNVTYACVKTVTMTFKDTMNQVSSMDDSSIVKTPKGKPKVQKKQLPDKDGLGFTSSGSKRARKQALATNIPRTRCP